MNIMLVEDSVATRKLVASLVEKATTGKHRIFEAGSAEEALEKLSAPDAPPIDIFLLDINLPGQSGAELCKNIRKKASSPSPQYPYVIMVTSQESEEVLSGALDAGANDYIVKPVNVRVLQVRLRVAETLCDLARLSEESEFYRDLVYGGINLVPLPMVICDATHTNPRFPIFYANRAMAAFCNSQQRTLLKKSLPSLQGWTVEFTQMLLARIHAKQGFSGAVESSDPAWSSRGIQMTAYPIAPEVGPPTHILVLQAAGH